MEDLPFQTLSPSEVEYSRFLARDPAFRKWVRIFKGPYALIQLGAYDFSFLKENPAIYRSPRFLKQRGSVLETPPQIKILVPAKITQKVIEWINQKGSVDLRKGKPTALLGAEQIGENLILQDLSQESIDARLRGRNKIACPPWVWSRYQNQMKYVKVFQSDKDPGQKKYAYRTGWTSDPNGFGADTNELIPYDEQGKQLERARWDDGRETKEWKWIGQCKERTLDLPNWLTKLAGSSPIHLYHDDNQRMIYSINRTAGDGGVLFYDKEGHQVHRAPQYGWEKVSKSQAEADQDWVKTLTLIM